MFALDRCGKYTRAQGIVVAPPGSPRAPTLPSPPFVPQMLPRTWSCSPMLRTHAYLTALLLAPSLLLGSLLEEAAGQGASGPLGTRPRAFAQGVVTTISPAIEPRETLSPHPMIEITSDRSLNWKPNRSPESRTLYRKAQIARFGHEVWGLDFSFKPLRMIDVSIRQADGSVERKMVWYLVYNVKNNGTRFKPVDSAEGDFTADRATPLPVEFTPHFVLEGQDVDPTGQKIYKAYLDRELPAMIETIRQREIPGRTLLGTAQMAQTPIEVSAAGEDKSVWGVALWEEVDPEMDFLSVFVSGLTNAYRWTDPAGAYKLGDPAGKGRRLVSKKLQLNFWRPGDEFLESEEEIRFGVPEGKSSLYDVKEGVAYRWIFR